MHIGLAAQAPQDSVVDLLCEINAYYFPDTAATREVVREHAIKNLLSLDSPHKIVVASAEDNTVVGLAAFTLVYSIVEPEPEGRVQCQLKELYVSNSHRGRGIGSALMRAVAKFAIEQGCVRIDWPVKASNTAGISFYTSLGAKLVEDRLSFRLSEPSVSELAGLKRGARSVA